MSASVSYREVQLTFTEAHNMQGDGISGNARAKQACYHTSDGFLPTFSLTPDTASQLFRGHPGGPATLRF